MKRVINVKLTFLVLLMLCVAAVIWWPSLYGEFYFDDWPNLSGLNSVDDKQSFFSFVFNATSSFIGRPLSTLTFALQADSWPHSPFEFKIFNLSIHLINGIFVLLIAYILAHIGGVNKKNSLIAAFVVSLIWLVHPLHANTIPYVVQRMTLLSGFFSLLTLLLYLVVRSKQSTWAVSTVLLVSLAIALLSFLGILSKENAVLTGMFILACELILIKKDKPFLGFNLWLLCISVVPVILVFLLLFLRGHFDGVENYRDFSVLERLLTQFRVLVDYLKSVVLPLPSDINLYNDAYQVSRGLFSPVSTILSAVLLTAISFFLYKLRKRNRWLLFGWVFFLFGHILESTILPLELYFDHRNYLPLFGIIFGLVVSGVSYITSMSSRNSKNITVLVCAFYAVFLSAVAYSEASTWGNPEKFAIAGFSERPGSIRARQEAANYFMSVGDHDKSARLLFSLRDRLGDSPGITLQLLIIECVNPELIRLDRDSVKLVLETGPKDRIAIEALHHLWELVRGDQCEKLDMEMVHSYASFLASNPEFLPVSENLSLIRAFSLADLGEFRKAAELMAPNIPRFSIEYGILCIRFFLAANMEGVAREKLDLVDSIFSDTARYELGFRSTIERLKAAAQGEVINE